MVYDYPLGFVQNTKNPIIISLSFGMLGLSYIQEINKSGPSNS
jgi:hypothetical protein